MERERESTKEEKQRRMLVAATAVVCAAMSALGAVRYGPLLLRLLRTQGGTRAPPKDDFYTRSFTRKHHDGFSPIEADAETAEEITARRRREAEIMEDLSARILTSKQLGGKHWRDAQGRGGREEGGRRQRAEARRGERGQDEYSSWRFWQKHYREEWERTRGRHGGGSKFTGDGGWRAADGGGGSWAGGGGAEAAGPDLYSVLGLRRADAARITTADIKRAFREQAKRHHPDVAPAGEKAAAEARFKEIVDAYDVLRHPASKLLYDIGGHPSGGQ